jgi:hypothetical protein
MTRASRAAAGILVMAPILMEEDLAAAEEDI